MVVEILLVLTCVGILAALLVSARRRKLLDVVSTAEEQPSTPEGIPERTSPIDVEVPNPASATESPRKETSPRAVVDIAPAILLAQEPAPPPTPAPVEETVGHPTPKILMLAEWIAEPTPQSVIEPDPPEPRKYEPAPTSNTLVTAQVKPEVAELTTDPVPLFPLPTSSLSTSIVIVRPGYVDRPKPQPIKPRSKPQKKSPKLQYRPKRSNRSLFEENWLHNCDLFESGEHYWFDTNQWGSDDWEGISSAHLSGASELIENVRGEFFTLPRSWGIRDHHDDFYWGDFEDDYRDFFHPDELEDPETDEMLSLG